MSDTQLAKTGNEPSIANMMQSVIEGGVTQENVAALEKLCDLYERMQARSAEQQFAAAFVELQKEMPAVEACKAVPNKDGSLRYKFAPYEEIMRTVQPILTKHGFTVTFNMSFNEGRIKSICTLTHHCGHSRANEFAVRIGGGPPGSTETQADGAAKTYAKRGALCDALNIVIEHDDDARAEGATIPKQKADELRKRVKACGADEAKFLAFAGASAFEEISDAKIDMLEIFLKGKEKKARESEHQGADKEW